MNTETLLNIAGIILIVFVGGFIVVVAAAGAEWLRNRNLPEENDADILKKRGVIK